MKMMGNFSTTLAIPILLLFSVSSNAGLIFGTSARTQFEGYQAALGDTLETFDGFAAQTNLTNQIGGLQFRTTLDGFGFHAPPPSGSRGTPINLEVNVVCSPSAPFSSSCSTPNRIIGGVRAAGVTDGQSIYEINFATAQLRAGLTRIFNSSSLTRFYSGATLLAEHQNTAGTEFVGFVSDAANPITRIEMDGLFQVVASARPNGVYNVGYSDDLFYGTAPLPSGNTPLPATWLLMLSGLWIMRRRLLA